MSSQSHNQTDSSPSLEHDRLMTIFMIHANKIDGFERITLFTKLKDVMECCGKVKEQWLQENISHLYNKAGASRDNIDLYTAIEKADKQELISKWPATMTSFLWKRQPKPKFTPSKTSETKQQQLCEPNYIIKFEE